MATASSLTPYASLIMPDTMKNLNTLLRFSTLNFSLINVTVKATAQHGAIDPFFNPSAGASSFTCATTNAEGRYTIQTSYVGAATLQASWPGLPHAQTTIEVPEHDTAIQIDVTEMVVG
jgi:hypothetical protein